MGPVVLRVRLFGALDIRADDQPLPPLDSARAESLLAYLLLHRDAPQPRQQLAFLLWPDSAEQQARTNLRHVLHTLRHALPESERFLEARPRTLQWSRDTPLWLDVVAFEDALAIAQAQRERGEDDLTSLQSAIALYTEDLLPSCYDEWLLTERERLRQRYFTALERLIEVLEIRKDFAQAIVYGERLLLHDPLHEETYRLLMRLYDARGNRARALRVYHLCVATLERELGVEPSARTREVYEALLPTEREPLPTTQWLEGVSASPFVGRANEWNRLTRLWRVTEAGSAQCVLAVGEPGVGKTRLIEELRTWCVHRGARALHARAYAAEGALAYGPLAEWLRSEPLKSNLQRLDQARRIILTRLLPELLAEEATFAHPALQEESDERQRLFDAAAHVILATEEPLLLVADDLQWWDEGSLQFLHYLLRIRPEARLLLAATARREDVALQHPLNDLCTGLHALGHFIEIDLERLSPEETAVLAERVLGHALQESDVHQLYTETEGSPLFVVEALRAGWDKGWMSPKVQAVIESRLTQLSPKTQELVGVAATIGREFTSEALAFASEADENTLVRSLDELWRRRIIREEGIDGYDFSHDKIREVAYLALSPAQRRRHHLHVAQALERLNSHELGPVSGQIASHFEHAGVADRAITWYQRAASAAQQLYANTEAVRLLDKARDLTGALPASAERDARELEILIALSGLLGVVEGLGSSHLAEVQGRALALTDALAVDAAPPLLRSLSLVYLCRDDFTSAQRVGLQLRSRGEHDDDDVLLVESDYVMGIAAFWQGELDTASQRFAAAIEGYHSEHLQTHLLWYGQDPKITCMSRLANTLWYLGRPESALRMCAQALALADEIGYPFSRATALVFAALLALDMRDLERFREWVALLVVAASQLKAQQILVAVESYTGVCDVLDGHTEQGMARLQRALDATLEAQHSPGQLAMITRLLIEACGAARDSRAGLVAANQAFEANGARLWDAESHRCRAEFFSMRGAPPQDIEEELKSALQISRRQGARTFELRAAVSLLRHRLERDDGQAAREAHTRLGAIVKAIPEQMDTPDVYEATTLLRAHN